MSISRDGAREGHPKIILDSRAPAVVDLKAGSGTALRTSKRQRTQALPKKKIALTFANILAIIATLVGVSALHLRFQAAAQAEKTAAVLQGKTDSKQDSQIDSSTKDIVDQREIHREDMAEMRQAYSRQSILATQRQEEVLEAISKVRGP